MNLVEVAAFLEGKLEHADASHTVESINTLCLASSSQVAFLANQKYKNDVLNSQAGVILLGLDVLPDLSRPVIRLADPYVAYAKLQSYFYPQHLGSGQRASTAVIHAAACLADDVDVADGVVIGADVVIGAGCRIGAGCVLEKGVQIGTQCILHPRVVIQSGSHIGNRVLIHPGAVIGADGFGFAWSGRQFIKIPQVGQVFIEDDVEIGANTCIDRAALGETRIGYGVKIDNLVQIAHNVEIGAYTVIAGQAGFAGSATIGKGCQFGGQCAVAGHVEITDACLFAGKSGVVGNVSKAGSYSGYPAIPLRTWLRASSMFARLPELWRSIISKK